MQSIGTCFARLCSTEVIAVNQDEAAQPMRPVRRAGGLEVWKKKLAASGGRSMAVVLFHRNDTGVRATHREVEAAPATAAWHGHQPKMINVSWEELGLTAKSKLKVRDLWAKETLGDFHGFFNASVGWHEAKIYTFTPSS